MLGTTLAVLMVAASAVFPPWMPATGGAEPVLDSRQFPIVGHADYGKAHHDYPATDIFAACGSPVVAPMSGVVLEVGRKDRWDPATNLGGQRGGRYFSIRGDDHVRYYGSHLRRVRPGLAAGDRVDTGERLGRVGRSGDAAGIACHLHFGLSPVCRGRHDWWIRRGEVSPYRFLRSWEDGGDRSPRHAVRRWKRVHGCPQAP